MCLGKINLEEINAVARLGSVGQEGGHLVGARGAGRNQTTCFRLGNPAGDSLLAAIFLRALECQLLKERALALTQLCKNKNLVSENRRKN